MVVRMRSNRSHTGHRRSHHALISGAFSVCDSCGTRKISHAMCQVCGKYKGRIVIDVIARIEKKEKKRKEREKAAKK